MFLINSENKFAVKSEKGLGIFRVFCEFCGFKRKKTGWIYWCNLESRGLHEKLWWARFEFDTCALDVLRQGWPNRVTNCSFLDDYQSLKILTFRFWPMLIGFWRWNGLMVALAVWSGCRTISAFRRYRQSLSFWNHLRVGTSWLLHVSSLIVSRLHSLIGAWFSALHERRQTPRTTTSQPPFSINRP